MTMRIDKSFAEVLGAKADVVISDIDHSGGLNTTEILAWRGWFDKHRQRLKSSGGRPTNPNWSVKRQVAFAPEIWESLRSLAEICSASGQKVGPGQVAGFLLEEAVQLRVREVSEQPNEASIEDTDQTLVSVDDPRFRNWTMPELFSGCAA